MPSQKFDVLCVGIVVADTVCRSINRFPEPGGLELTEGIALTVGGCAANVAADLAQLGRRSAIVGKIGADVFGDSVRDILETSGVDCGFLNRSQTLQTAATMIVNITGEDRRFIHTLGANTEFTGREVTPDMLEQTRILSLGGYGLVESMSVDNIVALFQSAKNVGVTTVLDVVLPGPLDFDSQLAPILALTDYFLPNDDEAQLITGLIDPVAQAERFHAAGAKTVVITGGDAGSVLISETDRLRCAAFPVEVVDTTGSGDAFLSGFVHAMLNDGDVATCLKSGSALGAMCAGVAGSTTGIPPADDLADFTASHELDITPIH